MQTVWYNTNSWCLRLLQVSSLFPVCFFFKFLESNNTPDTKSLPFNDHECERYSCNYFFSLKIFIKLNHYYTIYGCLQAMELKFCGFCFSIFLLHICDMCFSHCLASCPSFFSIIFETKTAHKWWFGLVCASLSGPNNGINL